MTTLQIETQLTFDRLLANLDQLSSEELNQLAWQAVTVRTQRKSDSLLGHEAQLLETVNRTLPATDQLRYDVLIAKRDAELLTEIEVEELLALTDSAEQMQVDRLQALIELAALRRVSVHELMTSLGIRRSE